MRLISEPYHFGYLIHQQIYFPESLSDVRAILILYLNVAVYESNFGDLNEDSLQFCFVLQDDIEFSDNAHKGTK